MAETDSTQTRAPETPQTSTGTQTAAEEEWFDLLPVEKKMIGYSLSLGIVLLVIFVFAFGAYH
jgi:hypothetical protein